MSPGATMERVYHTIKRRIMHGDFAPGERLESILLARELGASATPVRDALHRLAGERLLGSWHQEGFRQPILTEADLHDLYAWSASLLRLALDGALPEPDLPGEAFGGLRDRTYPAELEQLFRAIAWLSGNRELRYAMMSVIERSHVFRAAELRVEPLCRDAVAAMDEDFRFGRWSALRSKIARFHRRRARLAGRVVVELRPRDEPLR